MKPCHYSWQSMSQTKIQGLLGLCKRAGKLITGTDLVLEAVRSGKKRPYCVLLCKDASANTEKKVRNCCTHYEMMLLQLPMTGEELAHCTGKTGVVATAAVTDDGFMKALLALLSTKSELKEQREDNV